MKQNVLIVNYNTQDFTSCAIRSVNKATPNCNIFVFDNSDREPFMNDFENVKILDNTNSQIVKFSSKNISYMHCLSIEKSIELIDAGFVLLDSDTLVKKNLSVHFIILTKR